MPRARATLDHSALAAAFAPDGLHGVSAAELAARANVAKPTLYARGRSKDALLLACVEAEVERLVARLHAAEERSGRSALPHRAEALADALLDHAARRPRAFRLLHVTARHRRSTVADDVDRVLERIPARIAVALRRDAAPGAPVAETAVALHGAASALALAHVSDRAAAAALLGRATAAALGRSGAPPPEDGAIEVGIY